jgi:hypothetical protein
MKHKKLFAFALIASSMLGYSASALAGKEYTPEQLRSMVNSGNPPKQGQVKTASSPMSFYACVAKIEAMVDSVSGDYPTRTIVNTNILRTEKIWTNDSAMTFSCSALDNKSVITTAAYQ